MEYSRPSSATGQPHACYSDRLVSWVLLLRATARVAPTLIHTNKSLFPCIVGATLAVALGQGSPSLLAFIFDCAKNNLVDQLFDRSAIIGKIDSARMLLTYVAVHNAFPSHTLEQRIGQTASIYHEI